NDGAFDALKDRQQAEEAVIRLEHGQPIRFGAGLGKAVVRDLATGDLAVVTDTDENESRVLVHDAHAASPATAFALSRLADPDTLHRTPIGVFRSVERPVYDTLMADQLDVAHELHGQRPVYDTLMADQLDVAHELHGKGDLGALLAGNDTWTVAG
ncbi:hypothetical protein ACF1FE_38170, partial [Streptomyces griseofuscus]